MPLETNADPLELGPIAGLGHFHKTLQHDAATGFVDPAAYLTFHNIAVNGGDFDKVPQSPGAAKLINPQAGWAHEHLGPNPADMRMPPPPAVHSLGNAAEMTELFWMALLRDKSFDTFIAGDPDVEAALTDLRIAYGHALAEFHLGADLPASAGKYSLTLQNLFRANLPDEDKGPLVSQFFLNDIAYGTQIILQQQFPYAAGKDYLTNWTDWLKAQNSGNGADDADYPGDNDYGRNKAYFECDAYTPAGLRRIRNMRDLARFVNKDALHQAYFNAALLLSNWNAPLAPGNPYNTATGAIKHQRPFGTLGGPHLLAQVSEVAARALRVVWLQKWGVYRRLRPEVYGGLMEAQANRGVKCGLPNLAFQTEACKRVVAGHGNHLLPIAFTAGSPAHPAYGAGHATVAGACVTILKAWFDEKALFSDIVKNAIHPITRQPVNLWAPNASGLDPMNTYTGTDLTLQGELNKLAANVAMGRSMGGVHWRTDNTRSLRLGEKIATIILRREAGDYQEKPTWSYTNFDGNAVTITADGTVTVAGDKLLEDLYNSFPLIAPDSISMGVAAGSI
ncbi:MAG: vanadium-dependent haloperoxidase [Bryobacteraceae bacterium]